jgi:hypothetical protein
MNAQAVSSSVAAWKLAGVTKALKNVNVVGTAAPAGCDIPPTPWQQQQQRECTSSNQQRGGMNVCRDG